MLQNYLKKITSLTILILSLNFARTTAQPEQIYNAAELEIAIQKLNVLASVLYLAAHPDDENTGLLAYFSKGRKYRSAYLSLTRGDGGQNLIGPEKGAEIGILRTQELLQARHIDAAEQFFTRAIDFGYSKTAEETFKMWGKEDILKDIVYIIRKFRPDVIITRFPLNRSGGHGHHTASAQLAVEAFKAAADPSIFPHQLKDVQPWQSTRILWNSWRPDPETVKDLLKVNIGEYNPLLGKSYSEIAAESRSMHKSQGFGAAARRGDRFEHFEHLEGEKADKDIFEGIDLSWNRIPQGENIGNLLDHIINHFNPKHPEASVSSLLEVYDNLLKLENNYWVERKRVDLQKVIQSCLGLWMEAIAEDYSVAPGNDIQTKVTLVNRSSIPVLIERMDFSPLAADTTLMVNIRDNEPYYIDKKIHIPDSYPVSQPFWLEQKPDNGLFTIGDPKLVGQAENSPSIEMDIFLNIHGKSLKFRLPLLYRWTDRVEGEQYRTVEIRPLVTLNLDENVVVFPNGKSKQLRVKLKNNSAQIRGTVQLTGSKNWEIKPRSVSFSLNKKHEEQHVLFDVTPPQGSDQSVFYAEALVENKTFNHALVEISYPHIPKQVYFPKSELKLVKLDIEKSGQRIGYIMGAGDDVPAGLRNLGYEVLLLDDNMIDNTDLTQFDAIITGIRAYNTRERLNHAHNRLLQYVKEGGTMIVQYNVAFRRQPPQIGPFPFTISRDRVSVETAPVFFLEPDHQLLNVPNKITQKDFEGWVQERGLYFASQWDKNYTPVISSHDPGESDKKGSILFTRYGKGVFIYTGISWFRQLPAGIPGAYRLFANLVSSGKQNGKQTN